MVEDLLENPMKMTPEMQKRIEDLEGDIKMMERALVGLKELGLNTKDLEEKYEWVIQTRNTLLKRFT